MGEDPRLGTSGSCFSDPKEVPEMYTDDRLRNMEELAEYLDQSRASIYKLLHQGLPSIQIGRSRRFRLSEVNEWLDARRTGGAA